ncbi:MAG: hypothetical protein A3E02_02050 [Candidatus Zambryskibacteria bacterium RIFCSPHIGHO2_12_FULL_38_34]|uniref:Uncharacterized protein n=1 Tax=Candidatus Zambryskibacteria bacterium RIFCSPLOWO2_12_FULL_39_16 TaxID=1802775 RepID=A0A1G2UR23_9BACT|nr:MAG: hypothetical protein A3D37_01835 [Candidatus Zambryskibacteria bacterium RIFCSPHIGHO2_02_FULL_38_22]OHA97367.1 MAG: hypothetical protein A3E02_02050 [Candidatus Zambryskibacteria bacterium RIFCSPHIGHO2_12_FULL_38_34]OHB08482.1 MAG: hypothetical protein A3I19_00735 [Candidatus Zambryskibacteria bacterium RIFCSPLOWO2_02_FULL_38_13]OHB11841.1 MAG: hypothetical protein A3G46_01105 [Candidatus Zambryskibacteria bacterium RIFCSPLOWO2_12_FULL_39_16]
MADEKPNVVEVYWKENGKLAMCDPLLKAELTNDRQRITIVPTGDMLGKLVSNTCCQASVPKDWFDTSCGDWVDGPNHWQAPQGCVTLAVPRFS